MEIILHLDLSWATADSLALPWNMKGSVGNSVKTTEIVKSSKVPTPVPWHSSSSQNHQTARLFWIAHFQCVFFPGFFLFFYSWCPVVSDRLTELTQNDLFLVFFQFHYLTSSYFPLSFVVFSLFFLFGYSRDELVKLIGLACFFSIELYFFYQVLLLRLLFFFIPIPYYM